MKSLIDRIDHIELHGDSAQFYGLAIYIELHGDRLNGERSLIPDDSPVQEGRK